MIRKCCEPLHTDQVLLALLMQGLDAWFHHTQEEPIPWDYPPPYRHLVQDQSTLGWHQLFNGWWSLKWATLQDQDLQRHFEEVPDPLLSRHKWTASMIIVLWTSFRTLWDLRNGKVHGFDTTAQAWL
jgi:hypothetical protein